MTPKEEAKEKIANLVTQFAAQIDTYKKKDYNESTTRDSYINPFFEALGWDISNATGKLETERDVKLEVKQVVDDQTKRPDYCFTKKGKAKFYLEAKKPSIVIKDDAPSAKQVRRYTWSAKLPVAVLTDFEELAIYDGAYKVKEDDSASVGRLKYLKFTDYEKEFDFLWDTLSREAVWNGSLERFAKVGTAKKGSQSVDDDFLASLNQWRNYLATGIVAGNPTLDEEQINVVVQTVLDRIIFLRISEDRHIEKYGKLRECAKLKGETYSHLYQYFAEADQKYNSGLFDIKKDVLTKDLKITNKILKTLIAELYHPKTPYEFSVMPVEILGNAYEQFLGKVIKITNLKSVEIEEKPAVRKAGGVYYTPEYIVEYIVQNTIGKKITEIEQTTKITEVEKEVAKLRIVDPSCGSGSFLLGAYQFLLDWHLNYYAKYPQTTKTKKEQPLTSEGKLTSGVKKRILLNNIFGVDIDVNAVEVTKLSLLLKAMEGETEVTIQNALLLFNERVLPTLDNNVRSGNSLIDYDFYGNKLDFDPFVEKKIKPFDWKVNFPQAFKQGGFDIVIGNPPWVSLSGRFGNDILNEEAHQYLIQKYHGNTYRPNLYEYFVHRGLDLVKEGGLFSFIIPDRLGFNEQFINLRKRILENYTIEELLYKAPFPNIVTDTLVFRFLHQKPKPDAILLVGEFGDTPQPKKQLEYLQTLEYQFLYQTDQQTSALVDSIFNNLNCVALGTDFETKVGVIVDTSQVTKERTDNDQKVILKGRSIGRYTIGEKFYIDYTKENIKGGTNDVNKLGAPEKVLLRKTGIPLYATYDNSGIFPEQSLYFIFNPKNGLSLKYMTALINSKLFNFLYINALVTNKDSTPQIKKVDLDKFPVRLIDMQNATDKKMYDDLINAVEMIMGLHAKLQEKLTEAQRTQWEKRIIYYENLINDLVLDLYDITNPTDRELILQS